jgi:hypothetical protein
VINRMGKDVRCVNVLCAVGVINNDVRAICVNIQNVIN